MTQAPTSSPLPDPTSGLWLRPNKDDQNTSRADLPGHGLDRPREIWSYGHASAAPSAIRPIEVAGRPCFLVQRNWQMRLLNADGSALWPQPLLGPNQVLAIWPTPAGPRILARWGLSGVTLIDAATGSVLWQRLFDQGFIGAIAAPAGDGFRLFLAPTNSTRCLCFQWDSPAAREPRLLWEQDYAPRYYANFGPLLALGDMDNDGRDDLVLVTKPSYVAVVDANSGKVKFDLHYPITGAPEDTGRPYGQVQLVDLDGDGFLDLFIAPFRVEEYFAVIRNDAGKALRHGWSRFVEKDFPEDHRELHPAATSVADLDGDGKPEVVLSLFNQTGDGRWHTLVLDPLVGDTKPLQDWPDRYFWGCFKLGDDTLPRVIVGEARQRDASGPALLEAREGKTGRVVASVDHAAPVTRMISSGTPTPYPGANYGERREPIHTTSPSGPVLLLAGDAPDRPQLLALQHGQSRLAPATLTRAARVILEGASETSAPNTVPFDLRLPGSDESPKPAVLATLTGPSADRSSNHRELVLWLSNGTITGGMPDLAHPGRLRNPWRVSGTQPSLWIARGGRRVLCALHPTDNAVLVYRNPAGDSASVPPTRIDLPFPPQRRGSFQSALVPFTVAGEMRLFVSLVTGRDTVAAALYDAGGKQLWLDRDHGTCPHPPAIFDLDGDGQPDLLLDDHGRQAIYQLDGRSKLFAQAWHDTIPGRDNGAAHALPIVGPFGPAGETRMVMAPGFSAFEVCDAQGNRVARRAFAGVYDYYFAHACVARRADKRWDLGVIHRAGRFEWIDTLTLETRATLDLARPLLPSNTVIACDLDGDGNDEFIVGLSTGQLLAVGLVANQPRLLWEIDLHAEVVDLIAADVDGDGRSEIIVTTSDGVARIFR